MFCKEHKGIKNARNIAVLTSCLHSRSLLLRPPSPQVAEHSPHGPHSVHAEQGPALQSSDSEEGPGPHSGGEDRYLKGAFQLVN